ncbi:MAG: hypothetical protein ABR553_05855 [Gammaproteobacteria bacterium]
MRANKPQQALPGGERPLAQSVFDGEARLRELGHLAETARKVRDQAAAELTRNSSAHHIARERIAAAERMLRKTQKEIAELREKQGVRAPAVEAGASGDFELAMLLGHSKARFNPEGDTQTPLQLQSDKAGRAQRTTPRGAVPDAQRDRPAPAGGRRLLFGALVGLGLCLGALGSYAVIQTGSVSAAAGFIHGQGQQLWDRLRTLAAAPAITGQATSETSPVTAPVTVSGVLPRADTAVMNPRETQETQARAAAEQRLTRQLTGHTPNP